MRVGSWVLVLVVALPAFVHAQEKPAEVPPRAGSFFKSKRVSFWGAVSPDGSPGSESLEPSLPVESLWAEPIRLPDGRMTIYVPPKQVLAFLETPNEESGKAYLAWQKERMEKLARASEILARLAGRRSDEERSAGAPLKEDLPRVTEGAAPTSSIIAKGPASGSAEAGAAEKGGMLLYFKQDGCPHCKHQDPEIAALLKARPDLKLKVVLPGEDEELWKANDVRVVPTVILLRADGKKGVARGYTPLASLVSLVSLKEGDKP